MYIPLWNFTVFFRRWGVGISWHSESVYWEKYLGLDPYRNEEWNKP